MDFFKKPVFVFILLVVFAITISRSACAGLKQKVGVTLTPYTSPDGSYSIYMPKGWTMKPESNGFTIVENPRDNNGTEIQVLLAPVNPGTTSLQFAQALKTEIQKLRPDLKTEIKQVSKNPDIVGVLFTYTNGGEKVIGFGFAVCRQNVAMWADIYGRPSNFQKYNGLALLSCVVQSMNAGTTPKKPVINAPQKVMRPNYKTNYYKGPSGGSYQQRINQKAVEAHMWNMAPYLAPSVFTHPF